MQIHFPRYHVTVSFNLIAFLFLIEGPERSIWDLGIPERKKGILGSHPI